MRSNQARGCAAVLVLSAAVALCSAADAGDRACLVAGSDQTIIDGKLGLLEGLGPAAFIVVMPGGYCVTGDTTAGSIDQAAAIQLYSNSAEGMQDMYRLKGRRVIARGRVSVTATYQQHAPVLMEVLELRAK